MKETLPWHWQRTQSMEFESNYFHQRKSGFYFVMESHIVRSVSDTHSIQYGAIKEIQREKLWNQC